jgi:hypothetical protein
MGRKDVVRVGAGDDPCLSRAAEGISHCNASARSARARSGPARTRVASATRFRPSVDLRKDLRRAGNIHALAMTPCPTTTEEGIVNSDQTIGPLLALYETRVVETDSVNWPAVDAICLSWELQRSMR